MRVWLDKSPDWHGMFADVQAISKPQAIGIFIYTLFHNQYRTVADHVAASVFDYVPLNAGGNAVKNLLKRLVR